jgi:hypothetical protein
MATIRVVAGMSVTTALSRAFHRARAMRPFFCSAVISPKWTRTSATPGRLATRRLMSFMIWARNGQPAVVKAMVTSTSPFCGLISMTCTMPRSTMLSPSSGSITPSRTLRTASSVTGLAGTRAPYPVRR